jgi:beta-glucosidase
MPRSVGQIPVHSSYRAGGGRSMFFGDYTDSPTAPLFPFGHGLSYTSFAYEGLAASGSSTAEPIELSVTVRNTGARAGDEVVQLYVRDEVASVARPDQMLVGFARVALDSGQTRRLTFTVHPSRLAFYNVEMRFVTEPGMFTFSVGASSADIRAVQAVELGGATAEYRQREIVATRVAVEG